MTGLLREDVFAQGNGEEDDFCVRAGHLGWRHVAVPSVFVAHVGGQPFGSAKAFLIERNMRNLTAFNSFRAGCLPVDDHCVQPITFHVAERHDIFLDRDLFPDHRIYSVNYRVGD
jgi:GT2 family glycosyltransferase